MTHTQGKWKYEESTKTIRNMPNNYWLATMDSWDGAVDNEANANFIVKACNSHDELLEACKKSLDLLCTGYENGIAQIKIEDAGHVISSLKNAIEGGYDENSVA